MARKISVPSSPSSCSFDELLPMALPFCTQIQRRESPSPHSKALKMAAHSTKSGLLTSQDGLCIMSTERANHWSVCNKILTPSIIGYFLISLIFLLLIHKRWLWRLPFWLLSEARTPTSNVSSLVPHQRTASSWVCLGGNSLRGCTCGGTLNRDVETQLITMC